MSITMLELMDFYHVMINYPQYSKMIKFSLKVIDFKPTLTIHDFHAMF